MRQNIWIYVIRNSKKISEYVNGKDVMLTSPNLVFGQRKIDFDLREHLIEGANPIDCGTFDTTADALKSAIEKLDDRLGANRRGVTLIHQDYSAQQYNETLEGLKQAGRKDVLAYYGVNLDGSITTPCATEKEIKDWMKNRGQTDLVTDIEAACGWEEKTVIVLDTSEDGAGIENIILRAVSLLIITRVKKK